MVREIPLETKEGKEGEMASDKSEKKQEIKYYKVRWARTEIGESWVKAKSKKEAKILCDKEEDIGFQNYSETYPDSVDDEWKLKELEEVSIHDDGLPLVWTMGIEKEVKP